MEKWGQGAHPEPQGEGRQSVLLCGQCERLSQPQGETGSFFSCLQVLTSLFPSPITRPSRKRCSGALRAGILASSPTYGETFTSTEYDLGVDFTYPPCIALSEVPESFVMIRSLFCQMLFSCIYYNDPVGVVLYSVNMVNYID